MIPEAVLTAARVIVEEEEEDEGLNQGGEARKLTAFADDHVKTFRGFNQGRHTSAKTSRITLSAAVLFGQGQIYLSFLKRNSLDEI